MKPKNISLALYLETKARLNKARFPHTFTLTRWINQAICDKLDREHPETVGASPMVETAAISPLVAAPAFDPMVETRRLLRLARGRDYVGPYTIRERGKTSYLMAEHQHKKLKDASPGIEALLEDMYIKAGEELTPEEVGRIMAAHAMEEKALADAAAKRAEREAETLKADAAMEVRPVKTAKLAEDEEGAFDWDDAAYLRIKAKAGK